MTEMPSYMIENPKFESHKPKKRSYHPSSMLSILLSILAYFLIFYVFQVSPSSIFKDTKVLFFISNTLILILAADYGAFTDKESDNDFYGEYTAATAAMRGRTNRFYSPIPPLTCQEKPRQQQSFHAGVKNPRDDLTKNLDEHEPMVKDIVCVSPPERTVQVVSEEKPREDVSIEKHSLSTDQTVDYGDSCNARKQVNPKTYGRSKSDKPRRLKVAEDKKTKRKSYGLTESNSSKWMVAAEEWENVEEESEEFSKMSTEELNKRAEDFIQRFNRQMRLQSRVLNT